MLKRKFALFVTLCLSLILSSCKKDNTNNNLTDTSHSHVFTQATCTEPAKCDCGITSGTALGHDYKEATCTTPKICLRCEAIAGLALEHDYSSATCTSPQICKRCENVIGTPIGHDYTEETCFLPKTCKNCNATKDSPLGHTYVDNVCIRCELIDPNSLPTPIHKIHLISSYDYKVVTKIFDTFGNPYTNALVYNHYKSYSTYNLDQKYAVFSGSIVPPEGTDGNSGVAIYVDNVCVYTIDNITKETLKIDFTINVKGATTLKIVTGIHWGGKSYSVAIVNAELTK